MSVTQSRGLRVAIASQYPGEDGRMSSGVEGVVSALADGLADAGAEVHVVTCVTGTGRPTQRTSAKGVTIHSVPSPGRLAWLLGFPLESRGIRSVLERIRPDIVHCHTQTLYAYAALERGWPSILTIHGIYAREVDQMRGWRRVQGGFLTRFERDAIRRAKNVVCISAYVRRELGEKISGKHLRMIENPVDDRFFQVGSSGEEPGRILYAGTVINRKRLMVVLEAIDLLRQRGVEVRLGVAGSQTAEPGYYAKCREYLEARQLDKNVEFLGVLAVDGLAGELARANLLVLSSSQETAPMVVSEAMAAGKAVVATPAGGTADMVEDGKSGYIVPFDDPAAAADAIGRLLADADLRNRMGATARSLAEERHRLSQVVGKTIGFYKDVISGSAK